MLEGLDVVDLEGCRFHSGMLEGLDVVDLEGCRCHSGTAWVLGSVGLTDCKFHSDLLVGFESWNSLSDTRDGQLAVNIHSSEGNCSYRHFAHSSPIPRPYPPCASNLWEWGCRLQSVCSKEQSHK